MLNKTIETKFPEYCAAMKLGGKNVPAGNKEAFVNVRFKLLTDE